MKTWISACIFFIFTSSMAFASDSCIELFATGSKDYKAVHTSYEDKLIINYFYKDKAHIDQIWKHVGVEIIENGKYIKDTFKDNDSFKY